MMQKRRSEMDHKEARGSIVDEDTSRLLLPPGSTEKIHPLHISHQKHAGGKGKVRQLKPTASKEASRLEDQMNFEHLKLLESIFNEADTDDGGGLAIDEFRTAMKKTMGSSVRDEELDILFMKVDTNCDGTVDWDEYLSYMLLEYQEKDTMTSLIKEVPFPNPLRELASNHRDIIVRISFLQNLTNRTGSKATNRDNPGGKYLSLSKEGQLGVYGLDFELQKSFVVGLGKDTCIQLWMTDMAPCANVALVAVSSTEREISFYDVAGNKLEKKFQLVGFKNPVLTMDYWFNHDNLNCCTLVVSDANGSVIVFRFSQAMRKGLFGVYPQKGVVRKIALISILRQKIPGAYCLVYENLHSNLVNSAQYFQLAQGLECFISCSATDNDSMYLGDLTNVTYKTKWPGFVKLGSNRGCYYKIRRGILALDYSKEWNLIVTGSFDGVVRTWNPGSCKPASVIKGHHSPVQHCTIISGSGQIITCGKDRVGVLEGYDDNEKIDQKTIKSHDGSVSTVLYNKLFNQVVTAGDDSVLSVWDLTTGTKAIQFYTVKGVELTCLCFDQTLRRLITGSRNGAVKIWNFNNGACLRTLTNGDGLEITGIVCHKQQIITTGWSRKIAVYIDSRDTDDENECILWKDTHQEDVLCFVAFHHGNGISIAASCSYDGNIFIWSLDSGHILCRLNRMLSYSPLSSNGIITNRRNEEVDPVMKEVITDSSSSTKESDITGSSSLPSISITHSNRVTNKTTFPPIAPKTLLSDVEEVEECDIEENNESAEPKLRLPKINCKETLQYGAVSPEPHQDSNDGLRLRKEPGIFKNNLTPSAGFKMASADGVLKPLDTVDSEKKKSLLAAKKDPIRHQLKVLTGQDESYYWEAEVSVDKLLFLQNRPHLPHVATLLSSGAFGWVHAWSVHPQGGLLGQFVAAHFDGEVVLSMATDQENKTLITGDSSGYIKIWNIGDYCCKKNQRDRRDAVCDLLQVQLRTPLLTEEEMQNLSSKRLRKLHIYPPEIRLYFRGHLGAINDITYIDEKKLILSACLDGTVRLWTVKGLYVGTFGQKKRWDITYPWMSRARMPGEIKRVASYNTLRVLNAGHSTWRQTKTILKVAMSRLGKEESALSVASTENTPTEGSDVNSLLFKKKSRTDVELEQDYQNLVNKLQRSNVLGNSYKPTRRHRHPPKIDLRPHFNNFHVHSSIPFSELKETEEIAVPELLKEKWKLQKELAGEAEHNGKRKRASAIGFRTKVRAITRLKGNSQTALTKLHQRVSTKGNKSKTSTSK